MCGIVDANVVNEVFGDDPSPAGERFFEWLASPRGQLVVGSELRRELSRDHRFIRWLRNASQYGRARTIPDETVEERMDDLRQRDICKSNDKHVLALAIASGAGLLYTNDNLLRDDFKNRNIVPAPPGKIYTTRDRKDLRPTHKKLLGMRNLCRALELIRIRGHLTLWGGGIHHAEIKTAVRAGVPAPDG